MKKLLLLLFLFGGALTLFSGKASAQTYPTITMQWTWSLGNGNQAVSFNLARGATTGGPYSVVYSVPISGNGPLYTYNDVGSAINTLVVGTTYYYVVAAVGNGGLISSISNEAAVVAKPFLPPNAPTALSGVSP
jgi:hypothetical protein